jgi:hypothetical protein
MLHLSGLQQHLVLFVHKVGAPQGLVAEDQFAGRGLFRTCVSRLSGGQVSSDGEEPEEACRQAHLLSPACTAISHDLMSTH